MIGSRSVDKAQAAAGEVLELACGKVDVQGMANTDAARDADLLVLTVPFSAHKDTLAAISSELQGKILVDVTVPLVPPRVTRVQMPLAGSAAQEAQEILGPNVQVVAAFQNISYEHLLQGAPVECDVLCCGGTKMAHGEVIKLVQATGLVGWDAGPIENAVVVEGMTSILIGINKQFGIDCAGIKITGHPRRETG